MSLGPRAGPGRQAPLLVEFMQLYACSLTWGGGAEGYQKFPRVQLQPGDLTGIGSRSPSVLAYGFLCSGGRWFPPCCLGVHFHWPGLCGHRDFSWADAPCGGLGDCFLYPWSPWLDLEKEGMWSSEWHRQWPQPGQAPRPRPFIGGPQTAPGSTTSQEVPTLLPSPSQQQFLDWTLSRDSFRIASPVTSRCPHVLTPTSPFFSTEAPWAAVARFPCPCLLFPQPCNSITPGPTLPASAWETLSPLRPSPSQEWSQVDLRPQQGG